MSISCECDSLDYEWMFIPKETAKGLSELEAENRDRKKFQEYLNKLQEKKNAEK